MVMTPSSSGCRSDSIAGRVNCGSSSINSTPLCASEISPGRGVLPPPVNPAIEMEWCGDRNTRFFSSGTPLGRKPAAEWILVVSTASSKLISGRIEGRRLASMLLPVPGGPISSTLCPPAAAISSARLAFSCPFTSLKSGIGGWGSSRYGTDRAVGSGFPPLSASTSSRAVRTG